MSILSTPTVFSNRRPSVDDTTSKVGGGTLSRRLTLPLENAHRIGIRRTKQNTLDQLDSPLFKLPYELREQIWRYVLGGKCIAHDTGGFRFGDASNPWPPWELPEQRKLRGLKTLGSLGWVPGGLKGLLSLLITCRRAYVFTHDYKILKMLILRIDTQKESVCSTQAIYFTSATP